MTGRHGSCRRRFSSGGPWESVAGYSRAVVVGDACWVAGTTDAGPDGSSRHPGDPAGQARAVFGIIGRVLDEAGFTMADVVRTRMFVTDIAASWESISRVHGEVFGDVRPVATMVQVGALIHPSLLVEIEVDARRD